MKKHYRLKHFINKHGNRRVQLQLRYLFFFWQPLRAVRQWKMTTYESQAQQLQENGYLLSREESSEGTAWAYYTAVNFESVPAYVERRGHYEKEEDLRRDFYDAVWSTALKIKNERRAKQVQKANRTHYTKFP